MEGGQEAGEVRKAAEGAGRERCASRETVAAAYLHDIRDACESGCVKSEVAGYHSGQLEFNLLIAHHSPATANKHDNTT